MTQEILCAVLVIVAALAAGGCGVQIGTPDYWREYNESVRGARKLQVASLEKLSERDREELNGVVRRVGR